MYRAFSRHELTRRDAREIAQSLHSGAYVRQGVPYSDLTGDPVEWAADAMEELRHYQRSMMSTQKLVILFHRQYFTASSHVSHWQALIAALKAQLEATDDCDPHDVILPRFDFSALPRPTVEMVPMLAYIRSELPTAEIFFHHGETTNIVCHHLSLLVDTAKLATSCRGKLHQCVSMR